MDDTQIKARTSLFNMAICHLFSEIRYMPNVIKIDRCENVGSTILKAYPSLSPNQLKFLELSGRNSTEHVDDKGNFEIMIPLSLILG